MNIFETIAALSNMGTMYLVLALHRSLKRQIAALHDELNRPMPDQLAKVWKPAGLPLPTKSMNGHSAK